MQRYKRLPFGDAAAFLAKLTSGFNPKGVTGRDALSVVTLGSCFAENLHKELSTQGVNSYFAGFSEEINSPMFNAVFLKEKVFGDSSNHHELYLELTRHEWYNQNIGAASERLLAALAAANNVIFTVGLAQLWVRLDDGSPVLLPEYSSIEKYATRLLYPQPQAQFLTEVIETIRSVNKSANIILTLSPVPLSVSSVASVAQADCISKSILRVAIELVMGKGMEGVHYYPSFEFFRWYSGHVPEAAFGLDGNHRHPSPQYVSLAIAKFLEKVIDGSPEGA